MTLRWIRASFWLIPSVFVVVAVALALLMPSLDRELDPPALTYSSAAATEVLASIAAGMIAFAGFVFTIVLLLVQFGSAQYSPRLLQAFSRDPVPKLAIGTFTATFTYALIVLSAIGSGNDPDAVPNGSVTLAIVLVLVSVFMFLWLLHHTYRSLQLGQVLDRVARRGRQTIDNVHPDPFAAARPPRASELPEPDLVICHTGEPGSLQAVDLDRLARLAAARGIVLSLVPAIGDFIATGTPLVRVHGDATGLEPQLRPAFRLGTERTDDQDPGLAIRWLVDIANKALSPAVNDPTTAVQVLDEIDDLLGRLAERSMASGSRSDDSGTPRVVYPVRTWENYLALALTEIRQSGSGSPQVVRRLRALLTDLQGRVPPERTAALRDQLALLDDAAARAFPPGELAVAQIPDRQGFGPVGRR